MSKFYVHYRKSDGEIFGWETTIVPGQCDGCKRVELEVHAVPDPRRHKIDLATLTLSDKSPSEIAAALVPTDHEVRAAIFQELCATDSFAISDRPMTDAVRAGWKTYRQALRDLSKLPSPVEMVNVWPTTRPDGIDAAAALRARIGKKL